MDEKWQIGDKLMTTSIDFLEMLHADVSRSAELIPRPVT